MKKDWRSLLWCTILVGTTGASEDDSKLDQCKDRLSRYYRSHFEDENELHVPNACQSCCCSNNTNQVQTLHTTLQSRILGQSISLVVVPATISKSGKLRIIFYSCDSILSHSQMSTASWAATEKVEKLIAS